MVQVVVEALPVPAVVDLVHLPVLALAQVLWRRVQLPLLARRLLLLLARAHLPVPVVVALAVPVLLVLAGLPVLADLVVAPEVLLHLLSRQSFSAAMARSFPSPEPPTYEPVRRSRWPPKGRPCRSA